MRDRRSPFPSFDSKEFKKHVLILIDGTQQDFPFYVPILILFYYLFNGIGVFLPYFGRYKRRVSKHKVKEIIKLFGNLFRLIEVILEVVRVVFPEFLV